MSLLDSILDWLVGRTEIEMPVEKPEAICPDKMDRLEQRISELELIQNELELFSLYGRKKNAANSNVKRA